MTSAPASLHNGGTARPPQISVGIAGWSYEDWKGFVYPPGTKDTLAYIAPYVDCIEINSSFYRPPSQQAADSWRRRTEHLAAFFFTAKLHQDVTHRGRIDPRDARSFLLALAPLIDSGRLRHLLAQFRYDFADTPPAREALALIQRLYGHAAGLIAELRHNSWQSPAALDFLRETGVTPAHLDYPTARDSFNLRLAPFGSPAYLRLHGRNRAAWFSRDAGRDETYNYLYSPAEVAEIAERAVAITGMSKSLTVIANNHYQGKEAVNALQIMSRLRGTQVPVPPLLLEKYPELRDIAAD